MQGVHPRTLAGRETVLAAVLQSLRRPGGHGAVIAAETGLGKTAVAAAIEQALAADNKVYRVYASPALKAVPYGALAALLPDLEPEETDSPVAVMRALTARLHPPGNGGAGGAGPGPGAPLVIVDDAHDIDGPGLDLLAQLLDAGRIRLLVLTRTFADVSAVLPHMWDGQLTRHQLLPLTETDCHQLCEQELQGQVSATASVELARLTGGNPMFMLSLIEESVRSGFLVEQEGIWGLSGAPLPVGGRIADLVKAQLRGLAVPDRTALEIICLAEPLLLSTAFKLGMHTSIDSLAALLLVQVTPEQGHSRALRPLHPIYGEVIRSLVPAARSARLFAQLQGPLPASRTGGEGLLRWVAWSMDLGSRVPDAVLLEAAEAANDRSDPRLALRAAAAVAEPSMRSCARIQEARALLQLGETEPARMAVDGIVEQLGDLRSLEQLMTVVSQLALLPGGGSGPGSNGAGDWAEPLAAQWTEAVVRLSATADRDAVARAHRGARMLVLLGKVRNGDYAAAEPALSEALRIGKADGDDEAVLLAEALTAEVLTATGRAEQARRHSSAAMDLLRGNKPGTLRYCSFVLHRHLAVLLWLGDWEEIVQCVRSADSPAQQTLIHAGGIADFALGMSHLRTGDMGTAARSFAAAAEAAASVDPEGILTLSLGLGSFAAASQGHRELATRLLAAGEETGPRGSEQTRLLAAGILAGGRAARNPDEASLQRLRNLAAQAQDRMFPAVEFTLRHLSLRLGDFTEAARLLKVTEGFEGPQAALLSRVARAVVDRDVAALVASAAENDPEMDLMLARECLLEALRVARRGNDRAMLNRIQRMVGRQGDGNGAPLPELTRRERDVAALVAAGYRNAEIARQLDLSVRTVEGHIYRTYEKLGIRRRDELKAAFASLEKAAGNWMRPSG